MPAGVFYKEDNENMTGLYFLDPRLTAEDYENMAKETAGRNSEMLERNGGDLDDCFVSAACHQVTVRVYHMLADLARNGGMHPFTVLKTMDGRRVNAKVIRNRYDRMVWALLDRDDRIIGFAPYKPSRPQTLARRGYIEAKEELPAAVFLVASSAGLAGMYPIYIPDRRRFIQYKEENKNEEDTLDQQPVNLQVGSSLR